MHFDYIPIQNEKENVTDMSEKQLISEAIETDVRKVFLEVYKDEAKADAAVASYNKLISEIRSWIKNAFVYMSKQGAIKVVIKNINSTYENDDESLIWVGTIYKSNNHFCLAFTDGEVMQKDLNRITNAMTYIDHFLCDLNVISKLKNGREK